MEETKTKKAPVKKAAPVEKKPVDNWEYKTRRYFLIGMQKPLTHTIPSKHSQRYPLVYFDKDLGYERELRYATNQKSIFVDEQKGSVTLKHIVFEDGILVVPSEKRNLQEFLEKHPHNGVIFNEFDPIVEAEDQYDYLELEIDAMNIAYEMDIDHAEAIMRVEVGSSVSSMSSKELKRDLLLFAKKNPKLLIDLANDENVILRNFAIRACEENIIELSQDQRSFTWKSNGRKLMNIPFDENAYSAMAAWFKTDEGLEVYRSIEKKFK
jgi:hypothetical protein|tara:strand:+ start:450 stop:1250 length:801 start_codon:yes stop_codon:yes gene_type:complete